MKVLYTIKTLLMINMLKNTIKMFEKKIIYAKITHFQNFVSTKVLYTIKTLLIINMLKTTNMLKIIDD